MKKTIREWSEDIAIYLERHDGRGDFDNWGHSQRVGIFNPGWRLESSEEIFKHTMSVPILLNIGNFKVTPGDSNMRQD